MCKLVHGLVNWIWYRLDIGKEEGTVIDLSRRVAEAQGWFVRVLLDPLDPFLIQEEHEWWIDGATGKKVILVDNYHPDIDIAQAMAFAREKCLAHGWHFTLYWNEQKWGARTWRTRNWLARVFWVWGVWTKKVWGARILEDTEFETIGFGGADASDMSIEKAAECICEAVLAALEK